MLLLRLVVALPIFLTGSAPGDELTCRDRAACAKAARAFRVKWAGSLPFDNKPNRDACAAGDAVSCAFLAAQRPKSEESPPFHVLTEEQRAAVERACRVDGDAEACAAKGADPEAPRAYPGVVDCELAYTDKCFEEKRKVVDWLERACTAGAGEACTDIGALHQYGRRGFAVDEEEARRYYRHGCDYGSGRGCLLFGISVGRNPLRRFEALRNYRRSCDLKSAMGCCFLGLNVFLGFGRNGSWFDLPKIYRRARDSGAAPFCLGMMDGERRNAIAETTSRR